MKREKEAGWLSHTTANLHHSYSPTLETALALPIRSLASGKTRLAAVFVAEVPSLCQDPRRHRIFLSGFSYQCDSVWLSVS